MASQFGKKRVQLHDGEVLIHTYNIIGKMGSRYFIDDKEYLNLVANNEDLKLREKIDMNIFRLKAVHGQ